MARGTNTVGDLLTRIGDKTPLNDLWRDHQAVINEHNAKRNTIVQLLTFPTTLAHEDVLQSYEGRTSRR